MELFTFVTQSSSKVEEAKRILREELQHHNLDLPEIQALDVEEVVAHKVKFAYRALGGIPVMVEDTGLYIDAWNGLPGALIKWFDKSVGNVGICQMLHAFPDRSALAKTAIAIYDGDLNIFLGETCGKISFSPRGEGGFGWDKVFIPEGSNKTFGEMSPVEKDLCSMRRKALEAMKDYQLQKA